MTKVISFKVSDEVYNRLKSLDGTFRDILMPLVKNFLNESQTPEYTHSIRYDRPKTHDEICTWLDSIELTRNHCKRGF